MIIAYLAIIAILGFVVGSMAKSKGHDFTLWFVLGGLFFLPALIILMIIPDANAGKGRTRGRRSRTGAPGTRRTGATTRSTRPRR